MPNLANLIERRLSGPSLRVLRTAARVGGEDARAVYLVGGLVRDILRGESSDDIDLSVVGDAELFAERLAGELGLEVAAISEFGTARIGGDGLSIDLVTARSETYDHPGALPDVEPAGIKEDLARRDFTVNAMAVDLNDGRWGELIDDHGGMSDLMMRRLRTLHDGSFSDDPTRALRAVRYAARLGMIVPAATADLMRRDARHMAAVSPARLLAELKHILGETSRAEALKLADELGVLAAVSPALRVSARPMSVILAHPDRPPIFHVALIGAGLTAGEADAVIDRVEPPRDWCDALRAGPKYREIAPVLERPDLRPSEISDLLAPFPVVALEAQLELAPATQQKRALRSWLEELRFRAPLLTGDDLLAAGVPQGPLVGVLLDELRRARLDRAVGTRDDELTLVKRRLPVLRSGNAAGNGR